MSSKYQEIEQELAQSVMGWEYTCFFDSTPTINGKPAFHMKDDGVYVRDPLNGYSTHWQPSKNLEQAVGLLDTFLHQHPNCEIALTADRIRQSVGMTGIFARRRTGSLPQDIVTLVVDLVGKVGAHD